MFGTYQATQRQAITTPPLSQFFFVTAAMKAFIKLLPPPHPKFFQKCKKNILKKTEPPQTIPRNSDSDDNRRKWIVIPAPKAPESFCAYILIIRCSKTLNFVRIGGKSRQQEILATFALSALPVPSWRTTAHIQKHNGSPYGICVILTESVVLR